MADGRIGFAKATRRSARRLGWRGLTAAVRGGVRGDHGLTSIERADLTHPVWLRTLSSDVFVYEQVFGHREYAFDVARDPRVIVDAGANIGLAAVLFASRFPSARIIAIEPDADNFAMLERNASSYENLTPVHGALWPTTTTLALMDEGFGEWGFTVQDDAAMTERERSAVRAQVPAYSVDELMRRHDCPAIDVLKIDIEGSERELFADPSAWIDRVDGLIVELHDRMRPRCSRSFYCGTPGFAHEWHRGENVYLSRGGCLQPPADGG